MVGRDIRLDQSQIATAVSAKQQGGNINITAGRSLWLGGLNANAQAPSAWIVNMVTRGTTGNGGTVTVQAPQLTLQDGAAIQTLSLGSGAAGAVQVTADTIKASGNVALSSPFAPTGSSSSRIISENYASGAGGDLGVVARQINLDGGGQIGTFVFPGATGHGGNITLNVADTLSATGISPTTLNPSGIGAFTFGIGNGGNINISTGTLNLIGGGLVNAFVTRLAGVPNTGKGNAGDVTITADKSISVVGTNPYAPTLSSFLGSITTGSGNAGNVSITTPNLSVQAGGALNSSTVPILGTVFGDRQQSNNLGNGGNLTLNVADKIEVMGVNQFTRLASGLGTVTFSNGYAGNTVIKTNQLVVKDGGAIIAVTVATGNAGELDIQANDILVSGENGRRSIIGANAAKMSFLQATEPIGFKDSPN
ncbi:MAG: hypothetical protein ACSI46_25590 [Gloeotrichia echinulata DVL01]|nr:hypothetical protein [Gloeotrichia echinulata DEX184]